MPVRSPASRDLRPNEDFRAVASLLRARAFQEPDPKDHGSLQRDGRSGRNPMNILWMNPAFEANNGETGVFRPYPQLRRSVQHPEQKLFGDVVRPCTPV